MSGLVTVGKRTYDGALVDTNGSTVDADSAFINSPPKTARTLQSKLVESVSIKDYGALGNGVADDTEAIKKCIADCRAKGLTTIIAPAGIYVVSEEIEVQQNVRLQGQGGGQQNFAANFTGTVFQAANGAFLDSTKAVLAFTYATDPANPDHRHFGGAYDLVVDGRKSTGNLCKGIRFAGVRYTNVARCGVYRCGDSGIFVGSDGLPSNDIRIVGNDVMYNGQAGIEFYGGDSFIMDNVCAQNVFDGITGQPGHTIIRGNSCWFNRNGIRLFTPTYSPLICGNQFYDNLRCGVVLDTVHNVVLSDNIVNANGRDNTYPAIQRAGVEIAGTVTGVMSGNTLSNIRTSEANQQYGLSVANTTGYQLLQNNNNVMIGNVVAPVSDTGAFVTLTAANTTLAVGGRTSIVLSSDSASAGARIFVPNSGVQFGQQLVIRWSGTNTGRLVDNSTIPDGGGFVRLTSNWDPATTDATLVLLWCSTGWVELSRCTI